MMRNINVRNIRRLQVS